MKTSQEKIDYIIEQYKSGKNIVEIQKDTGITRQTISNYLKSANIKVTRDRNRKPRKRAIQANYFSNIDTQDKAYILGFLYADGCNMSYRGTVRLNLQYTDIDILEKIRDIICPEQPIPIKERTMGYKGEPYASLNLYSNQLCHDLEKHGCMPAKTFKLEFPMFLPENLIHHFIRGYFDGDGSLSIGKTKHNNFYNSVNIVSTESFINQLKSILEIKFNIKCYVNTRWKERNNNTRQLQIGARKNVKDFLDWIYQDANLFLNRKYNKYISFLNESNLIENNKFKKVLQIDPKTNNVLNIFQSAKDVAEHLNCHIESVRQTIKKKTKLLKGYRWRYINEE